MARKPLTEQEQLHIDYRIETGHVYKIGGKMTKEYKIWVIKKLVRESRWRKEK